MKGIASVALAGVLLIALPGLASAQSGTIAGAGAMRCSDFTRVGRANDPAAGGFVAWAQGFMSAINIARDGDKKSLRTLVPQGRGADRQVGFLLAWCARQPNARFTSAALALYRSLPLAR
jgi:hypothetical protein